MTDLRLTKRFYTHGGAAAIAAALFLASAAPVLSQGPRVTLEDALRMAERVDPDLVQARGALRTAGAAKRTNTGSFLPSLSVTGSATRASSNRFNEATGQVVSVGSNTSYTSGLSLNLTIFDGLSRFAQRSVAHADLDAADAGIINQRFQVALQTKQAFFQALATAELVGVAETQVERAREQLSVSSEKLRNGTATRSDSLRSFVELGNARLGLIRAQANLAAAEAALGSQLGIDGRVTAVPDETYFQRAGELDIETLMLSAVQSAPSIVEAEAGLRAAAARTKVQRSQYWPTVTASYSNSFSGNEAPFNSTQSYVNNWNVRLSLRWPLFDGFSREQQIVNANVQRDVQAARTEDARRQVRTNLIRLLANLQAAEEQIVISDASLEAATEDLRVQQQRYDVGVSTIVELLSSQVSLDQAEVALVQARFDYQIARAELEALVGRSL